MRAIVLLMFACVVATPLRPQDSQAFKPLLGSWRGVCADGGLGGSVQLANMRGGDDGGCVTVVDPPSKKLSLEVRDVSMRGEILRFTGSQKLEFEMKVTGPTSARLALIGTASEENPWELRRTN